MKSESREVHKSAPGLLSRSIRLILFAIGVASGLTMLGLVRNHISYLDSTVQSSRGQLVSYTTKAASDIDRIVRQAMNSVDTIARDLDDGRLDSKAVRERLRSSVDGNPHFFGMTITYRPYGYDPKRRLYSAYFAKKNGKTEFVPLDEVYDYTLPEHEWYGVAIEKGAIWTRPYFDEAGGTSMITYSRPFFGSGTTKEKPLGVVTVDLSMDGIRHIIESLDLGPSGFGALVSADGNYLFHPNSELVLRQKSLLETAREQGDSDREKLAAASSKGETGILDHKSKTTGLDSWLVYTPVTSTNWSLQITFIKEDLPLDYDEMKRQQIRILLSGMALALCLAGLISRVDRGTPRSLWTVSCCAAFVFLVGIGVLWRLSLQFDADLKTEGVKVCDRSTLYSLMNSYIRTCEIQHTEAPVYIPTGMYLESAQFMSANDLMVSGYVWQKYRTGVHDSLTRGFTLANTTELTINENYRQKGAEEEIVRWQFKATVRQHMDHSRYPLELEQAKIRIMHKELNHNVVLVPDLSAYRFANPASLPGLEKGLALPGWKVASSFFEFLKLPVDTNFGIERSLAKENFPSLHFCMVIRRNFVDAFLSNLTPLIIVSILLFTLIMIASRDERLVGFLQAGSGRVLNICAAMFFVIAFSHIDIRRRMASEEIFYLEYYYFLIYISLLWVSVNSVLFAMGKNIRIIQYKENLISKLAYWPFLLGCLFAITLGIFY